MRPEPRGRLLAIAAWGLPVLALAWVVRVAVAVNYEQVLIYPSFFAAAATGLAGLWRSTRPLLKLLLLLAGLGLTITIGLASVIQGGHNRRIAVIATELMLEQTAEQYAELLEQSPAPRPCEHFACLADTLYGSERWPGLVVFLERERSLTFYPQIPNRDPWGCRFRFEPADEEFVLRCSGPDRRLRTADDIAVSAEIRKPGAALEPDQPSELPEQ